MKIVHVTSYYPPHVGGMEYRTKDLAENFAKRGHDVTVITSDIDCETGKLPSSKNLKIEYLKSIELAHAPIMPSLIFKIMSLPKDSIIHLHISEAYVAEITALIARLRGIPYLAHIHLDIAPSGKFGFLLPVYKKIVLTPVLRSAKVITVLTDDYKKLVSEKYNIKKNKISVIPNGTYFEIPENRKSEVHDPVRLLFVGRLSVQKNVPLLINAFAISVNKHKLNLRLKIAGDGEKRKEIGTLVKNLNVEKYVEFLGYVSPDRAQNLYQTSDVFVLPSKSESFGTVVIEAMGSGAPVIATDIPAVRNIIKNENNGLLVKEDPEDMAKAIQKLSTDELLRKKIIKNALSDVKKYNWETVTNQYEKVYLSIFRSRNK